MKIKIKDILSNIKYFLLFHLFFINILSFYLYFTGYAWQKLIIFYFGYIFIIFSYSVYYSYRTKKHLESISDICKKLEEPYYIADSLKISENVTEQVYGEILNKSCKSMIETVSAYEKSNEDYCDTAESWVHSVKNHISVISLICSNNPSEQNYIIQSELQKIENEAENMLFLSKEQDFKNDYVLKKFCIKDAVNSAILSNKNLLIENNAYVDINGCNEVILSDIKWLQFVFSQFISNSVKYKKSDSLNILIKSEENSDEVVIKYCDNGIGIPSNEINRIFEKGFTGTNGRKNAKSTGLGLYLCKTLCDKLIIDLSCESTVGAGTVFILKIKTHFEDVKNLSIL